MAEHRVSRLFAALCGAAVAVLAILPGPGTAGQGDGNRTRVDLDRECGLGGPIKPVGDARGGDARPTQWRDSPYLRPRGTLRTTMIFVDFADAPVGTLSTQSIRTSLAASAKRWLDEASYGQARLRVAGHHEWIRMPKPSTAYWPPGGIFRPVEYIHDAIAAADPAVDFSDSEIVYIVPAPGSQIVLSPAYVKPIQLADKTTLRRFVTFGQDIYGDSMPASKLIQGTAHLFSLPYLDDPGQAAAPGQRWAGPWDPMGEPELLAHPSAWSKRKLGWLDPGDEMICIRRGVLSEELVAISRRHGVRAISIRLSAGRRYVVEARRRHGFDGGICSEGVLVWLIDGSRGSGEGPMRIQPARDDSDNPARACRALGVTGALDRAPYGPGHTYRDRASGVSVDVLRSTRRGYEVRVARR